MKFKIGDSVVYNGVLSTDSVMGVVIELPECKDAQYVILLLNLDRLYCFEENLTIR